MKYENSLEYCRPNIAKYWHPTKNIPLKPSEVSKGSGMKVWWLCDENHEFEAQINNRVKRVKYCPYCSKKKVSSINSLEAIAPEIAKQWHPFKNGSIKPSEISRSSVIMIWWICSNGHEYEMKVSNKKTTQCPYCNGKRVAKENSLLYLKPEIAKQWHPFKNGNLTPDKVTKSSNKKVWWICSQGHEFFAHIKSRKNKYNGCPKCFYEMHTSFNEQSIYYYLKQVFDSVINRHIITKDSGEQCEVDVFIPDYNIGIEYDGSFHKKPIALKRDMSKNKFLDEKGFYLIRIRENGLPELKSKNVKVIELYNPKNYNELKKMILSILEFIVEHYSISETEKSNISTLNVNHDKDELNIYENYIKNPKNKNLESEFPLIVEEWDYEKNNHLKPSMFHPFSHKVVWWVCNINKSHQWKAQISNRTFNGNSCPYCSNQQITYVNSLKFKHPELLKKWNYDRNRDITPENVFANSKRKVWWTCENDHNSLSSIAKKVNYPNSCPYCSNKKVNKNNSLLTNRPDLVEEWCYGRNQITPDEVTPGSNKKVWWKCKINPKHIWLSSVTKRNRGRGCPYCSNRLIDDTNSLEALKPEVAKQWDYDKNTGLKPNEISVNSSKEVWWRCEKGEDHVWKSKAYSRKNTNCPFCNNRKVCKDNNLLILYPFISQEWNNSKNENLRPNDVVPGSRKKVWWKCSNGHSVLEPVRERVKRQGCAECKKFKKGTKTR